MELFDYTVLRLIWWALLGILLIAFAIMDGFDFGIAMLQPYVARNDVERRVLLNVIGPVWEGNQVWFILGGGAIFAAWPMLYAVSFSGFYLAMFLILLALIVRPVAIAFRGKVDNERWRRIWDWTFVVSGFVPSLIFGVAFGNLLLGVPFHFDQTLRLTYEGNLFGLLNPFSLLCGLISLLMIAMQGGTFLALKSEEPIAGRAVKATSVAAIAYILLFTVAGVWMAYSIKGYVIEAPMISDGPSNPLLKAVSRADGAWLANYTSHPWTILAPVVAYIGAPAVDLAVAVRKLAGLGLTRVLTEGGPSLLGAIIHDGLLDDLCLTIAPTVVGGWSKRISDGHGELITRLQRRHVLSDDEGYLYTRYSREERPS